jgi:hypothetical protein
MMMGEEKEALALYNSGQPLKKKTLAGSDSQTIPKAL